MVLAHDVYERERTQDIQISRDVTFDSMLLSPQTIQGLKNAGFYKPSPVQLHGIPLGKCGFDLLIEAKSGTGKTAVFTVIALEKLDLNKDLQVLVLTPTREIAAQISDVIKQIGSHYEGLKVEVVMGGLSVQDDIEKFKNKNHIVVGSPGRLRHLIQDKHIDVSAIRLFILDEADKLMEKSFEADIKYIYNILPVQKQVILSSATYPEHTKTFINSYVQNAQHIRPDSNCVLLGVNQKTTIVKYNSNIVRQTQNRFEELLKILTNTQFKQCLIFCNYQVRVTELHKLLRRKKWPAEQLYGQQEQTVRLGALKTLQEYKCRILISTDLAARGIDASNADLVINFEPPQDWQTYLHRIGRAGRFGSYGTAITILCEGKELENFKRVLGPLEESVNFTDLWSDNQIILNTEDISTVSHMAANNLLHEEKQNQCKYLWSILTDIGKPSGNQAIEMETFENLCKSFDDSYKIETFEDLLQNFENNKNDVKIEDSDYRYIETPNMPFLDTFFIKNMKNRFPDISKSQLENKTDQKDIHNISDAKKITTSFSEKLYYQTNIDSERLFEGKNCETELSNQKKKCGKLFKITNNNVTKRSCRNDVKMNESQNSALAGQSKYFNAAYSLTHDNKHHSKSENFHTNHIIPSSSSKQAEHVRNINNNKYKYYDYHSQTKVNQNVVYNNSYMCKATSYSNWYKQLKLQIKQIEYSIYVQEMIKM